MYVDAKLIKDRIHLCSYNNGIREITTHLPPYVFYYTDPNGKYTSIYGDKLHCERVNDSRKFKNLLSFYKGSDSHEVFESDVHPVFRFLDERFPTEETPPLKVSILDIEADKDPTKGWPRPDNPYACINAITVYNAWEDRCYTIALTPTTISSDEKAAELLASESEDDEFGPMMEEDGYFIAPTEAHLLEAFFDLIEDADVLTGWNSKKYDIPYMFQRIRIVFGKENLKKLKSEFGDLEIVFRPTDRSREWLRKFNRFDCDPEMRIVSTYGNDERVFEIFGRVHLDYIELYRKFTLEELHSYTLDFVLNKEIGQSKVAYEGTLEQLYRNDFRKFVAYNRQDVMGIAHLDKKLKMIELANSMSHMAGVTFDKVFGSVSIIEQAILKKLHRKGLICFDKKESDGESSIPGAFVAEPQNGLYDWVCSFDINSLYPSIIRSLNISPEVVVGQFKLIESEEEFQRLLSTGMTPTEAWREFTGVIEYHKLTDRGRNDNDLLTFVEEVSGEEIITSVSMWREIFKENNWSLSANGTVFSLNKEGIVAECLTEWYEERTKYKKKAKEYSKKLTNEKDDEKKKEYQMLFEYHSMVEKSRKLFLNSTYGAYANKFFRFHDPRLGSSVTLTGRLITKHMIEEADRRISERTGKKEKYTFYGDTDSAYATLSDIFDINADQKEVIKLADTIGKEINSSFPAMMEEKCFVSKERGAIIQASREVVARRGLFKNKKKRYALHVIDDEGKTVDKMKVMGMEIKRSDTPTFIQDFLEECVSSLIRDFKGYEDIYSMVEDFRKNTFYKRNPWENGIPCRVSNVAKNTKKLNNYEDSTREGVIGIKKPFVHYSVKAAWNTNRLIEEHNEHNMDIIRDGDKIQVIYLKPNQFNMETVAKPVDSTYIPEWFKKLPFDMRVQEQKLVDKKIDNVIGSILGWDFSPVTDHRQEVFEEVDFFDF